MCMDPKPKNPKENKVTVLGLGGAGGNIVHYIAEQCDDYNLLYADWDEKNLIDSVLKRTKVKTLFITSESNSNLNLLNKAKKLLIIAGLGGTFTAFTMPMIVALTQKLEIPTKLITLLPASFEGKKRMSRANKSLELIQEFSPDCEILSFDKLIENFDNKTSLNDCFRVMDEVVYQKIISEQL